MLLADYWVALGRKTGAWRHGRVVCDILATPPIIPRDDGVILFSMIGTRVLLPYLVAVKSLHRQLGRGKVMLLDDGTLTADDRALLAYHCGNPHVIGFGDIVTAPCPKGNCWERLLAILDLRDEHYVIQLDSDTVTLGPVPEVLTAIDSNRCFTLGGGMLDVEYGFMAIPEMIQKIYPDGPVWHHIQSVIEASLGQMEDAERLRYIRGCAGFTGFRQSAGGRALAEKFAVEAGRAVGPRFQEWGSEQVASNFVVANDADPIQLPYDRYVNHWAEQLPPAPAFIHYIGTYRYARGSYVAVTRAAIDLLNRQPMASG
ncbi:MAG: hypothetical protein ABI668_06925 [Sphingorhabdus sp.]